MTLREFTVRYSLCTNVSLLHFAIRAGLLDAYQKELFQGGRESVLGDMDDLSLEQYLTPELFMLGIDTIGDYISHYEQARLVKPDVQDPSFSLLGSKEICALDTKAYDLEHYIATVIEFRLSDSKLFVSELTGILDEALRNKTFFYPAELAGWVAAGIDEGRWQQPESIEPETPDPKAIIRTYRSAETELKEIISGQDAAIDTVIKALNTGAATAGKKNGPEATFLFTGPPGVGKTFLARNLANLIDRPFKEFSMTTFAHDEDFHRLVGFEKTWRNSQRGVLTAFLDQHPDAVVLFDEIEKAHSNTVLQFLSMLDGGYVYDVYEDRDIDCRHAIFIFTTNAGRSLYSGDSSHAYEQQDENAIRAALSKDVAFPPELLSRLASGCIIPFSALKLSDLRDIISNSLEKCRDELAEAYSVEISLDPDLPEYLLCTGSLSQDARIAATKSRDFLTSLFMEAVGQREGIGCINISIDRTHPIIEAGKVNTAEEEEAEDEDNARGGETFAQFLRDRGGDPVRMLIVDYKKSKEAIENAFRAEDVIRYESMKDCYDEGFELEHIPTDEYFDVIFVNPYFGARKNGSRDAAGIREGNAAIFLNLLESGAWAVDAPAPSVPLRLIIIDDEHPEHTAEDEAAYKTCYTIRDTHHVATRDALPGALRSIMSPENIPKNIPEMIRHGRRLTHEAVDWEEDADTLTAVIGGIREVYALDAGLGQSMVSMEHPEGGFDDIYGADEAKADLKDYVAFLKDPEEWYRWGIDPPKGVLLYGREGTGKTRLARTLAGEVRCPYFQTTGAEIISRGAGFLSELFATARKYSPSIIFIDEIDVAGHIRSGTGDSREMIVNTFLTEMDGFTDHKSQPVLVIAATNLPRSLDPALKRRFDKEIKVTAPTKADRRAYLTALKENSGKLSNVSEEDLEVFIERTPGATIAELEKIIRLAQRKAFRLHVAGDAEENMPRGVTGAILLDAMEEMQFGIEHPGDPAEKVSTAYHEVGHALLTKLYLGKAPYVSIVSRGDFGGYSAKSVPEKATFTRERLCQLIRISLAGRECERVCAEEIKQKVRDRFGRELADEFWMNSGAYSDMMNAVGNAAWMVCDLGMDENLLPLPGEPVKNICDLPKEYYDAIQKIVERERVNCAKELEAHRDHIRALADLLLEKSSLNDSDITAMLESA